ncbi:MAG: peptide ABC transporter substrate-binding protein [Bdellovibrionales bacterium]|nr:peptide ABC transporter substrate-binding protein [Bdellovibrionales bacterium]
MKKPSVLKILVGISVFVGLVISGAACSRQASAPASNGGAGTLRIQWSSEPQSWDPTFAQDGLALRILANTMGGLYRYDGDAKLVPLYAAEVKVSKDFKTYDFKIQGAWSDGVAIDSDQFKCALDRALDPKSGAKLSFLLKHIQKIETPSKDRLKIQLARPDPRFLHLTTLPTMMPLRCDLIAANQGSWPMMGPTTGDYRLADVNKGVSYHFVSNRGGHSVEALLVQDESTGVRLFESGRLDILSRVPQYDLKRMQAKGWIRTDPFWATYYLGFHVKNPAVSERELRKRVRDSIAKKEIVELLGTAEIPAQSWIPPGLEGHTATLTLTPANPNTAAVKKGAEIAVQYDSSARNATVMEKIQADLLKTLGIRLRLESSDWKTYQRNLGASPKPIFRFAMQAPVADPLFMLQSFTSKDPNNYTGWADARYDAWVDEIAQMESGPKRNQLIHRAQLYLLDEAVIFVPLYFYNQIHAVSPKIQGFRPNPMGVFRWADLNFST